MAATLPARPDAAAARAPPGRCRGRPPSLPGARRRGAASSHPRRRRGRGHATRPCVDERAGELAPLVLDVEETLLVGGEAEHVGAALEVESVGGVTRRVTGDALGLEPLAERVPVEPEAVGTDGDRRGHVACRGEEGCLGTKGVLELGDERVRPGEPGRPVLGRRSGLRGARCRSRRGPSARGRGRRRAGAQSGGQPGHRSRHGAQAAGARAQPEEGLGGDGAMRRVPAGMRAEEHREEPGGVTAVQDGTERLEHLSPDLGKLRPVELCQAIPCGALERLERGAASPWRPGGSRGQHARHCGSVPLPERRNAGFGGSGDRQRFLSGRFPPGHRSCQRGRPHGAPRPAEVDPTAVSLAPSRVGVEAGSARGGHRADPHLRRRAPAHRAEAARSLPVAWMPSNHFHAVRLGFNLLLVVEVIGLVFGLTGSPGRTLGRQFEILSLILLRRASRSRPRARAAPVGGAAPLHLANGRRCGGGGRGVRAGGALLPAQREGDEQTAEHTPELFAASKEAVALVVLVIFLILAGRGVSAALLDHEGPPRTTASSRASTRSWSSPT